MDSVTSLEKRFFHVILIALLMILIESLSSSSKAAEIITTERFPTPTKSECRPVSAYASNFGAVYVAQWSFYLVSQKETIEKYGSFDNFFSYPFHPEFDKDSFDYNLFKHALAGQYYYLFYRYRGYSEKEAFAWTFLSSLAFEFAVETYTERPSFQDIYQTPVYGTLLGMGTERLSHYLLQTESKLAHVFGYILNPFQLLNSKEEEVVAVPKIEKEALGFQVSWRF